MLDELFRKILGESGEEFKKRLARALDGCKERIMRLKPC
jgi:hypothetical protein